MPSPPDETPSPSAEHRAASRAALRCAVLTVSDTRTLADDRGGQLIVDFLADAGWTAARREIVPDEPSVMHEAVTEFVKDELIDAVLMTGGTGISPRDQTYETIAGMLTKTLPGYGELFRMLSFEEIGPAAMLSRAIGGVIGRTIILTMPGSTAAVKLAMQRLILPELPHLVHEATK